MTNQVYQIPSSPSQIRCAVQVDSTGGFLLWEGVGMVSIEDLIEGDYLRGSLIGLNTYKNSGEEGEVMYTLTSSDGLPSTHWGSRFRLAWMVLSGKINQGTIQVINHFNREESDAERR